MTISGQAAQGIATNGTVARPTPAAAAISASDHTKGRTPQRLTLVQTFLDRGRISKRLEILSHRVAKVGVAAKPTHSDRRSSFETASGPVRSASTRRPRTETPKDRGQSQSSRLARGSYCPNHHPLIHHPPILYRTTVLRLVFASAVPSTFRQAH